MGDLFDPNRRPTQQDILDGANAPLVGGSELLDSFVGTPEAPGLFSSILADREYETAASSQARYGSELNHLSQLALKVVQRSFTEAAKVDPQLHGYSLRIDQGHYDCSHGIKRVDDVSFRYLTAVGLHRERGGESISLETNAQLGRFFPAPAPTLALIAVVTHMSARKVNAYPIYCSADTGFTSDHEWLMGALTPGGKASNLELLVREAAQPFMLRVGIDSKAIESALRYGKTIREGCLHLSLDGSDQHTYRVQFIPVGEQKLAPIKCLLRKGDRIIAESHSPICFLYKGGPENP